VLQQTKPSPRWWNCICFKKFSLAPEITSIKSCVQLSRGRGWWMGRWCKGACMRWGQVAVLALKRLGWKAAARTPRLAQYAGFSLAVSLLGWI